MAFPAENEVDLKFDFLNCFLLILSVFRLSVSSIIMHLWPKLLAFWSDQIANCHLKSMNKSMLRHTQTHRQTEGMRMEMNWECIRQERGILLFLAILIYVLRGEWKCSGFNSCIIIFSVRFAVTNPKWKYIRMVSMNFHFFDRNASSFFSLSSLLRFSEQSRK